MTVRTIAYNEPPNDGDEYVFAVTIYFDSMAGASSRALRAMADYADAFAAIDAACAMAIDPGIETRLEIVRFENGSLRAIFASLLRSVDDEALKTPDWRRVIGAYLVKCKQIAIRWLDNSDPSKTLSQLQIDIKEEASSTDVRYIPAYSEPSRTFLIDGLRKAQEAKDELDEDDRVILSSESTELVLDMRARTDLAKVADLSVSETQKFNLEKVVLPIKKPDMIGHSQWQMKLGPRTIRASINDAVWLHRFQDRDISLKPGDALKCDADYMILLDSSGTPIGEKMDIRKVYGVEYQPLGQQLLL